MAISPFAGKPATRDMLVDLAKLEREYYERKPDVKDSNQLVSFGTSGHRGSSLRGSFNETHVLAITQAMSAPTPLRQDFDAPQVRGLARKTKDGPQARRLLALAAIYDGATRTEAAKIGGVGLQIIRDWVLRFNA